MVATYKITKTVGESEYRVRLFIDGQYQAGADYYTDDSKDALATARQMIQNACVSDKTTSFAKAEQAEYNEETGATVMSKNELFQTYAPNFNFELGADELLAKALERGFVKQIGDDLYQINNNY
jgi:hypothetical protein